MEWLGNLAQYGLPWWAVFALMLLTWLSTKGIDAWLKFRKATLEERQYDDVQTKEGYAALVAELQSRIEKLEAVVAKQSDKLDVATTAHAKCEIEQERLRGQVNVLQEKVARLEGHDKANEEHKQKLAEAVKTIDLEAATKLL